MRLKPFEKRDRSKRRIACVLDSHQRGLPTACAYIRLILPLSDPDVRRLFHVQFVTAEEIGQCDADIVIVQRLALATEAQVDYLLRQCRLSGRRLVYEIDDDLLSIGADHLEYAHYCRMTQHVQRLVEAADEVWVSTEPLAASIRGLARSTTVVIRNELDRRLWRQAEATPPDPVLRLLYMGSTTHLADFSELLRPAFERLRREMGRRVELTLIGVTDTLLLSEGIRSLPVPSGIGISYPSFASWLQSLRGFDLGLAPLLPTEFNQSKSHIKWLEYSAMGLVTIASDIAEYRSSIVQDVTGLLVASDPRAFYETVRELADEPSRIATLKQAAVSFANRQMAMPETTMQRIDRLASLLGLTEMSGLDQTPAARK